MVGSKSSSEEGVGVESLMKAAELTAGSVDDAEIADLAGGGLRGERVGRVGGTGATTIGE